MRETESREGAVGQYDCVRYQDPADAFRPCDVRSPEVALRVAGLVRSRLPGAAVEHIGSTAVPGCPGKGVVDLMHPYESGEVDAVRSVVEGLGFRLYLGRDPFPPERPVFVGTLVHDGDAFRLHLHIIPVGDPEAAAQRRFRDALRDDPALVMEYAERKRAILAAGAVDRTDYNRGKEASIRSVMTGDMDE